MTLSTSRGASAHHTRQLVCTLAEGHYFYGVAALVNSLVRTGFEGTVVIGFRGERPNWLERFARDPKLDTYAVTPSVQLRLIEGPGPMASEQLQAPLHRGLAVQRHIRRPISSIILIRTVSHHAFVEVVCPGGPTAAWCSCSIPQTTTCRRTTFTESDWVARSCRSARTAAAVSSPVMSTAAASAFPRAYAEFASVCGAA